MIQKRPRGGERPPAVQGQRSGLLFGGLCALNGAFVPAVARLTTSSGDPLWVAAVTTAFAGATAALVLGFRGELARLVRRHEAPWLLVLGALGTVLPFVLFYQGTQRTSAIEAVICLQVEPFYSLLLAWWVLGHRLTWRRAAAAGVLLAGVAIAISGGGERRGDLAGFAVLLATPLCWQTSHLLVLRRLTSVPPRVLTGARYVYGGLLLAPLLVLSAPTGGGLWNADLAVLALQGVVLSYCGTMFWYLAIARIDLPRATAIVVPSIPVLSLGVSFAVLGEVPTLRQLLGMAVTVSGVVAFALAPHAVPGHERIPVPAAPIALPVEPEEGGDAA